MTGIVLPTHIISEIVRYLPNIYFKHVLVLNKQCSNILLAEYEIRNIKHTFLFLLENSIIKRTLCISNISLGEKYGGNYKCKSRRDYKRGSLFCNFCNHIYYN